MAFNDGQEAAATELSFRGTNYDKCARLLVIEDDLVHRVIIC